MRTPLNIAFVWHMHQPIYKDPFTGEYTLPWVLLHATKDYLDMASILEGHPDVHQTFNLVPCLVDQLEEYASGGARDRYLEVSRKKAAELTPGDKAFILENFFQANWDHMVRPIERYRELLTKRGVSGAPEDVSTVMRYFTTQDYLDLQVLFNLVWVDPELRRGDEHLRELTQKGRGFTEEDKTGLFEKQAEIAGSVVPKYRELQDRGVIEVTTSPYYHPIIPLLCDHASATEAMPAAALPSKRFAHPEDARAQVTRAVGHYTERFKRGPRGMWPSEGSVSPEALDLIAESGIRWVATDEEILSESIKKPIRRDSSGNCFEPFLYRPYTVQTRSGEISVVFRDHVLSDLIGFEYARMDPGAAADDFTARLGRIHSMVGNPGEHLVSVILDGENAWETYPNDGRDFLADLYSRLSTDPRFRCVTVSEFLGEHPGGDRIERIFSGSWINHNFRIWIGHQEDNTAWDFLSGARDALVRFENSIKDKPGRAAEEDTEKIEKAWEALYAAEGSDWFWWYGDDHSSALDDEFDALFRLYVKRVYTLIGAEPPAALDEPISTAEKVVRPVERPTAFISPKIDGVVSNYFEWLGSGRLKRRYSGGAMHQELQDTGLVEGISYGFSRTELFLMLDLLEGARPCGPWRFTVTFVEPREVKISAEIDGRKATARVHRKDESGGWGPGEPLEGIASDTVVELAVALELLGAGLGEGLKCSISVDCGEMGLESWPVKGRLLLEVPGEDFELEDWIV